MIDARIFKANDIRGVATGPAPEWDTDGAYAIGAATAEVLDISEHRGAMVLARDMRTTSPEFSAAFAAGVLSRGADVVDIGLASTDALWFASGHLDLPGAMFTASHNPGTYNGIKFCYRQARPIEPADLIAIRDRALAGCGRAGCATGNPERAGPARRRMPITCSAWWTCRRSAGSRSWWTPATAWVA